MFAGRLERYLILTVELDEVLSDRYLKFQMNMVVVDVDFRVTGGCGVVVPVSCVTGQ